VADQVNAKVARVTGGTPVVTDGPYAEAKEYLGSFTIVDCDSLERALEIAARNPAARYWAAHVREGIENGQAETPSLRDTRPEPVPGSLAEQRWRAEFHRLS
jgi:hypothetical protein